MVATGQEMFRENKFSSRSGKTQGIPLRVRENWSQAEWNFKSTFVHFTDMNGGVLVEYFSWKWRICWCWVLKEMNPVSPLLRNLLIHLHCTWLVESINKWVGDSCEGGGGGGCVYYQDQFVKLLFIRLGQGSLHFPGKSEGISETLWLWQPCNV